MKLRQINKKGQVNTLAPAILALVFAAIVLVFGIVMTQEVTDASYTESATCNTSSGIYSGCPAYDAGNKTVTGLGSFADFWEIIVLAIVITIVIGLLLIIFGGSARRR